MSYTNSPASTVPDFNKAVISLWFRAPKTSMDAAAAAWVPNAEAQQSTPNASYNAPVPLNGIIPLVTFGKIFDAFTIARLTDTVGSETIEQHLITGGCSDAITQSDTFPVEIFPYERDKNYRLDQSYIGIDCTPLLNDPPTPATLCLRLQTGQMADMSGILWEVSTFSQTSYKILDPLSDPYTLAGPPNLCAGLVFKTITDGPSAGSDVAVYSGYPDNQVSTFADKTSDLWAGGAPEAIGGSSQTITIAPDLWHHVLVSFDLSGAINATGDETTLSSTMKLWVALDDVNYNGADLPSILWPGAVTPSDPNEVITLNALLAWGASTPTDSSVDFVDATGFWGSTVTSGYSGTPASYSLSGVSIPMLNSPLGLPTVAERADHIHKVEMAEFQMFTGVTLDTSVAANRRLFIGPDSGGNLTLPVNPLVAGGVAIPDLRDLGLVLSPRPPAKFLGKSPDIALVNSSTNWMAGINTGSSRKGAPPDGRFHAKGVIKPFLPAPRLGK